MVLFVFKGMNKFRFLLMLAGIFLACVSCSKKKGEQLKSPCSSAPSGPCDDRINPNFGWMQRTS